MALVQDWEDLKLVVLKLVGNAQYGLAVTDLEKNYRCSILNFLSSARI